MVRSDGQKPSWGDFFPPTGTLLESGVTPSSEPPSVTVRCGDNLLAAFPAVNADQTNAVKRGWWAAGAYINLCGHSGFYKACIRPAEALEGL